MITELRGDQEEGGKRGHVVIRVNKININSSVKAFLDLI